MKAYVAEAESFKADYNVSHRGQEAKVVLLDDVSILMPGHRGAGAVVQGPGMANMAIFLEDGSAHVFRGKATRRFR